MRPPPKQHLDEDRATFAREVPRGAAIWDALSRAGFEAVRVRCVAAGEGTAKTRYLHLRSSDALRLRFDLASEILACVAPEGKAQAGAIDEAEAELAQSRELDRAVVLFVSSDADAERRLAPVLPTERSYLFVDVDDLLRGLASDQWATQQLATCLGAARPFTPGAPVEDAQFFGRRFELQELERRLLQKSTPVGLFGLRKVGKTSLLKRFRREAEDAADEHGPSTLVVHCDVQAVPFSRRDLDGLLRALWKSAREVARRWPSIASADPSLSQESVAEAGTSRAATDALEGLVAWCAAHRRKLVVVLDEYERLLDGRSVPTSDGLDLLDFLRGLNQQRPHAFNYVFAGLSCRAANTPRFGERQNPLFAGHLALPLAGLSREELGGMLYKLGRRASLEFDDAATGRIADESGGHPFLARMLADVVDQRSAPARLRVVRVGEEAVAAALPTFEADVDVVMREIADAVQDLSSERGLTSLVDALEVGSWGPLAPALARDLQQFGLLENSGVRGRIGVFNRWLFRNVSPSRRVAHG